MVTKVIIHSPLSILVGKKKKRRIALNLNVYRNLHHSLNAECKIKYHEFILPRIKDLKFTKPIRLELVIYYKTRRRADRSNFLSIVEKFFCDSLVQAGCIPDDNDLFIIDSHYSTGGIDKLNPRAEIIISY